MKRHAATGALLGVLEQWLGIHARLLTVRTRDPLATSVDHGAIRHFLMCPWSTTHRDCTGVLLHVARQAPSYHTVAQHRLL